MSREDLNSFFKAVERSAALRKEIKGCKDQQSIIKLANAYGFFISIKDIAEDDKANKIFEWFKTSKISPLNNKHQQKEQVN